MEVRPQTAAGLFAQDLALDGIHARLDLQVPFPAVLEGSVKLLDNMMPPEAGRPFDNPVDIRAQGESEIIPGVLRSFKTTLSPDGNEGGAYSLPVSSGVYTITASALAAGGAVVDVSIPPLLIPTPTTIRAGSLLRFDLLLAAQPYRVTGRILLPAQPDRQRTEMDVQAVSDRETLRPLSQRARMRLSSDFSGGDFDLLLLPTVLLNRGFFFVQVSPRDRSALVPQKIFGPPFAAVDNLHLNLEMGDYGAPIQVTGTIVDSHGTGISNAIVYLDGRVGGGGTFRTPDVTTDASGMFSLSTLPSAPDAALWAIPPVTSTAGIQSTSVSVRGTSPIQLGNIPCPDKILVQGKIYKADGSVAAGVLVNAVPVQALGGRPLPGNGAQTTTDNDSSFSMNLDPAIYRLDFVPGEQLPWASRFAPVNADPNPPGPGFKPVQLPEYALSKARRITGNVLAIMNRDDTNPRLAPLTSIRFFRLSSDLSEKPSSVLLAETVSDSRGNYSVSLPTR